MLLLIFLARNYHIIKGGVLYFWQFVTGEAEGKYIVKNDVA